LSRHSLLTLAVTLLAGAPLAIAASSTSAAPAAPAAIGAPAAATAVPAAGSAVFLHPDGMGANTWGVARLVAAGPDGRLAWDQLPAVAVYVGPMSDRVNASSNGGATSHAWGVRAASDSFGRIDGRRIARARSGADVPLMIEARRAGKSIGVVNTASVTDAGTGAHLADAASRKHHEEIAAQMLEASPDVMLGGGEQWFLPAGVPGMHGPGVRRDGRNLLDEARARGYAIVRTRDELRRLPADATRVIGLFAADDTFEELDAAELAASGRESVFLTGVPRYDEMVAVALRVLAVNPRGFLLVAEEEATDNLAGRNNVAAVVDAALGADRAIADALALAAQRPALTVVVASDSDCGGLQARGSDVVAGRRVAPTAENGAPQHGVAGPDSVPFVAAPDRAGRRLPFIVSWAADGDVAGGLVVRGSGPGARLLHGTVDSTDVYSALYLGLFGREPRP
jgi:alkaline phosphatase